MGTVALEEVKGITAAGVNGLGGEAAVVLCNGGGEVKDELPLVLIISNSFATDGVGWAAPEISHS
jgi:hypothetical protein